MHLVLTASQAAMMDEAAASHWVKTEEKRVRFMAKQESWEWYLHGDRCLASRNKHLKLQFNTLWAYFHSSVHPFLML